MQRPFHPILASVSVLLSFLFLSVFTSATALAGPISVTKTDGLETAAPGDTLTYSIVITNDSKHAKKVHVRDDIPSFTTFLSASDGGKLKGKPSKEHVVWKNLQIPRQGSRTITMTAQVKADAPDGTVITNTVKVQGHHSATDTTTVVVPSALEEELFVTVQNIGTNNVVVENENNVTLLRFDAITANEDIFLTSASFSAAQGSLFNAERYSLWVDTDRNGNVDTVLQNDVVPQSGKVTFDNIMGGGYFITDAASERFEVHADMGSSFTTDTLQLAFDTASANYIGAERNGDSSLLVGIRTDGTCSTAFCEIVVTTFPSVLLSLKEQGNLYITQSLTPVRSHQLLGGTLSNVGLRLAFQAEWESIDVTDIVLTDTSGTLRPSISRLELFLPTETTPFAFATIDGCLGHPENPLNAYCANMESRQLVIPKGQTVGVLMFARMKTDEQGAISTEIIQLKLTGDSAALARGVSSANTLAVNDGDASAEGEVFIGTSVPQANAPITGKPNDTVLAKIIGIENVNPDTDGTNVPVGTNKRIAEFRFTAATNNNTLNGRNRATFSGIIFNVASTNVTFTASNFDLFNKNDQTQQIDCGAFDTNGRSVTGTASGSFFVECKSVMNPTVDLEMDSGEAVTLVLEADIINNQVNPVFNSALQVSLQDFSDRSKMVYGTTSGRSHVQWSDTLSEFPTSLFRWIENGNTVISSTEYDL